MQPKYRDFSISFAPNPKSGNISLVSDEASVNQSLRNLIYTNFYEIPFNPNLGSNIRARLFELMDSSTADIIKSDINDVIENFEPRVEVIDIKSISNEVKNGIDVTLTYRLRTSTNEIVVSYFLNRII